MQRDFAWLNNDDKKKLSIDVPEYIFVFLLKFIYIFSYMKQNLIASEVVFAKFQYILPIFFL